MDRRIGAQFYTVRDFTQTLEDFETSCRRISEIGYKLVQISGSPLPAAPMREVLDRYGLQAVTSHRNFADFVNHLDEIIDYNKTLGCELCGVGSMPEEYRRGERLSDFIREANRAGAALKEEGLYFGYHNHAFEFAKVEGKRIMDRLVEETDPETVKFIVDTYWLQVGGVNPADFIESLGERAMAVHFKDLMINPDKNYAQEMAEIGQGNLDWERIISACDKAGSRWALVEQDTCNRDPFESMKMSYDYLVTKGFY